ncbi:MAG TPA: FAD-dependent oxidoreductase, partial [Acetobacteraceae bacterium]|nr:FAD-dependent oxidoreductase [Acetobacteraceae bacterium]
MSLIDTRRDQIFPTLTPAQIATARRFASGQSHHFAPNEIIFRAGEMHVPAFLVLSGSLEVHRRDTVGRESLIVAHGPGQMSGEVSQIAGRGTLADGRAGPEGCEALPFDGAHLRALLIGSAEIGELLMRAFILRRTALIAEGGAGTVLVGHANDPAMVRTLGFLARNGYPTTVLDPATDEDGRALLHRLGVTDEDLPLMLAPDGAVLRRPTETELGVRLGLTPDLDGDTVYDVAVVGAGPAGLATAVYAASEGLSVMMLDQRAFGGQAGASARIENYLGFPTGITGHILMARAFTQAQKFGAEAAIPVAVNSLQCDGKPFVLNLSGEQRIRARSAVIASGARYRQLDIPNLADFESNGISYWASPIEAKLCAGEEVALVGGGNSAGQAVVFLAPKVEKLHLVIRRNDLYATMSRYLVDRIAALPNVILHPRTEITDLDGDAHGLRSVTCRNIDSGESQLHSIRHLFLFIGAEPNTGWLANCNV